MAPTENPCPLTAEAFKPPNPLRLSMKACVLVATEGDPAALAKTLQPVAGVVDAFPVFNRREVVVRAELRGMPHLAELLDNITAARGVIVSETLLEIPQVVRT